MAGRLAIDFGTSNTVVAVWDETEQQGNVLHIPDYGQYTPYQNENISVIPSLIHYATDKQQWVGSQVLQRNLYHSKRTFRWIKRYISNRSPIKMRLDGQSLSYFDAGKDFLLRVILFATEELDISDEEIALTVPVESFEHYENWLNDVVSETKSLRFRLVDEASSAALGYGANIQPGDVYFIFDFGGGTLDVSVVLVEEEKSQPQSGKRCRILGKAGLDVGGATIDQWLFQAVLRKNGRTDNEESVREISNTILVECERAKERLSSHDHADISVINPFSGDMIFFELSRIQFEDLLEENDLFSKIDRTIRRALNSARERGYQEDDIKTVLTVGGSSQIPAVQKMLRRIFGKDKVLFNRPLDAVARGAAAFVAGVDFYDHIQHDYGIRYFNRQKNAYDYRTIVERGTPYPSNEPIIDLTIKAAYDGQTELGLPIYEMSEQRTRPEEQPMELVFDPSGTARLMTITAEDDVHRTRFWMNEHNPTFLTANPPAQQSEKRFQIYFSIDSNKRLLINTHDLITDRMIHKDYPVVKLT
ncbi:MAG: heat-shock protein Hsp70 [Anaerolineaceae bacterium 4572_78]|nr:MAG: heat-shock protein Hsp70 [Anaerolineaceae bacterium 4572_78]